MPATVVANPSFRAGLKTEFLRTYFTRHDRLKPNLELIANLDLPSDKDIEYYLHWKSVPTMKRWIRGTTLSQKPFEGVQFSATNYEWARGIPWHFADEQDDQTKSLPQHVRGLANRAGELDDRVFIQIMTGGTDAELLDGNNLPTAPDGQNLFSTTNDGSTARFGVTNGNALTGTGTSEAQIRTDYHTAMAQFEQFQDTEGEPLFSTSEIMEGAVIMYPAGATLRERFAAVFQRELTHSVISSTGAGVSNEILAHGDKIKLVPTPRLTGNTWYIGLRGAAVKALFSQDRLAPFDFETDFDNSDEVKRTGVKAFSVVLRRGYGVAEPYAFIQVTNS